MPAWGFYPNGQAYGDTKLLGRWTAWTVGATQSSLTWVAEFPADATWQVWVRRYGGYGTVAVELDERRVDGGQGQPGGGRYVWISGTSMASPHVAGVAALIRSKYPNMPQAAVAALIRSSATPTACPADWPDDDPRSCTGGSGNTSFFGAGIVNALAAVSR